VRIPETVIEDVIRRINIVDLVGEYVNLTRKGDRFWGLSPFKTEKTPSFSVNPDRNAYYCFSTKKGGSPIQFIMELEHLAFPDAVRFLAKKYGIPIHEDAEVSPEYRQKSALEDLYKRLGASLHHILLHASGAQKALAYVRARGLSQESIEKFQLGYMPADGEWLYKFLHEKNYSDDILGISGLFSKKNIRRSIFYNRLMFPISNISRETIALGGRLLDGDGPKYINSPETLIYKKGSTLYGLAQAKDAIKKEDTAIICEGYMDVIALHQGGLSNSVAPLGTSFTLEQAQILRRLASKLILLFDGDSAGISATMKSLILAESLEFECSIVVLPDAKDPADILQRDGSQSLDYLLSYKVRAFDYVLKHFTDHSPVRGPEGKSLLVREFCPYLASLPTGVKYEATMMKLADMVGVSMETIEGELVRFRKNGLKHVVTPKEGIQSQPSSHQKPEVRNQLEFRLMLAVFLHASFFSFVRDTLQLEDLKDTWARDLFLALEESFRDTSESFESMTERLESEELRAIVFQKRIESEFNEQPGIFIKQGVYRLKSAVLESRRNYIEQTITRLQHAEPADDRSIRDLQAEKIILDQTLRDLKKHERSVE